MLTESEDGSSDVPVGANGQVYYTCLYDGGGGISNDWYCSL